MKILSKNLTAQQYSDLKNGGTVVVDGKMTIGKVYAMACKGETTLKAKCSSWWGATGFSSHLILQK